MYLRNLRLPKTWLDKSLNTIVLGLPSTVHECPKYSRNLYDRTFIIFFFTPREIEYHNFSLSDM